MTDQQIAEKAYSMYQALRQSGFAECQALGIISQFIVHLSFQSAYKIDIDFKSIVKKLIEG